MTPRGRWGLAPQMITGELADRYPGHDGHFLEQILDGQGGSVSSCSCGRFLKASIPEIPIPKPKVRISPPVVIADEVVFRNEDDDRPRAQNRPAATVVALATKPRCVEDLGPSKLDDSPPDTTCHLVPVPDWASAVTSRLTGLDLDPE